MMNVLRLPILSPIQPPNIVNTSQPIPPTIDATRVADRGMPSTFAPYDAKKAMTRYPAALFAAKISAARMTGRLWLRSSSPSGADDSLRRSCISVKTGDSDTALRMRYPTKIRTTDERKGIRQPQLRNCSSVRKLGLAYPLPLVSG